MNRREFVSRSARAAAFAMLALEAPFLFGCQTQETPTARLLREIEALPKTPTSEFIKTRIKKYYGGNDSVSYGDITVPLINPRVTFFDRPMYANASLRPDQTTQSDPHYPQILKYKPAAPITVDIPLPYLLRPDEQNKVTFPKYIQDPNLGRVPCVQPTYLMSETYYSFVNPLIQVGTAPQADFIRFALIKEAAAIALNDAWIERNASVMKALNLSTHIPAVNLATSQKIQAEIVTDSSMRLLSNGRRTPALIDLGSYGIATDAVRNDTAIMKVLLSSAYGSLYQQTLAYNFGQSPSEVMDRSFKWVLENPYVDNFGHVGNLKQVP